MHIIETKDITKMYGDFTANSKINLTVEKNEILAIVGENGAGKTTLMNMLYGLLKPTTGKIYIKGNLVDFNSPLDSINMGIGMVHQHFKLVPSLTIFENVLLGIEDKKIIDVGKYKIKLPLVDRSMGIKKVQKVADQYNLDLDVTKKVKNISIGLQQRVEILKMLYRNVDILILDEPTSVLTPQEVDELIISLKKLKKLSKTIIVITHKLREVMEVSDRVVVLKRGKVVGVVNTCDTNEKMLSRMMVGRDVILNTHKQYKDLSKASSIYKLKGIETTNELGKRVLKNITFSVKKGEILGVAGVEGNGQSELVKVVSGLMRSSKGNIYMDEKDITNFWPIQIRKLGISIIPEDRYLQGLCEDMSIADNFIAGYHWNKDLYKYKLLNYNIINKKRDDLTKKFDIRISNINGKISSLSGGNAQKVILAREFDASPKVLIVSQPTRGVDVGSIEFIHEEILKMQKSQKAILLVSNELSEIMELTDRIIVMYKGEIVGELITRDTNREEVGLLMAGITLESKVKKDEI